MKDYHRGNEIEYSQGAYRYKDTLERVSDKTDRSCGYCGKENTKEGHDGCLGELPGLMNACCGHGNSRESYIQFLDGECIIGAEAITIQSIMVNQKDKTI